MLPLKDGPLAPERQFRKPPPLAKAAATRNQRADYGVFLPFYLT
jgi:hypothetical protein